MWAGCLHGYNTWAYMQGIPGTWLTIHLYTQRAHQLCRIDVMQVFEMYWQVIISTESCHLNWWPLLALYSLYILKVSIHVIYFAS